MRYILPLILVALTGCAASPEQRAEDAIGTYGPACEKKGYTSNTDDWRRCVQGEQIAAKNFRAQEAEVAHRRGIYCMDRINVRSGRC